MSDVTETTQIGRLDRLEALEDIRVLKACYCRYLDTKDWQGFSSLFTRDAELCFPEGSPEWLSIDTLMGAIGQMLGGGISVHHVHSPEITFSGNDEATGIWAMQDRLFFPPGVQGLHDASRIFGAGHYHESYRRVDGRWLFSRIRLTRLHLAIEEQPRTVT